MASYDYDLIVIGSGAGGIIAAQQVAKAGKKVAVIEAEEFGGTDAKSGRLPTSALLEAANLYQTARGSEAFGIRGTTVGYNYPTVKAWKDTVLRRAGLAKAADSLGAMGITLSYGRAHFIDPHTVTIGKARLSAEKFLIATGSEQQIPDIPGLATAGYLTTREALELTRPPKRLAILGGSPLSYEIAELFGSFGSKVYFIESSTKLLGHEEPEVSETLRASFADRYSIDTHLEATLTKVSSFGASKRLQVSQKGKEITITADELVIATTHQAVTDIGLENAGIEYRPEKILTNSFLQTSAPHIYAAGGCIGTTFTHIATHQSQLVAYNILHPRRQLAFDNRITPRAYFVQPEIAAVGPTEASLKSQGVSYKSVCVPLSVIAKANTANFSDGFVKIMADRRTDVVLGGTITSPHATELISQIGLAVSTYASAAQLARSIYVFPSWSEVIRVACLQLAKKNS